MTRKDTQPFTYRVGWPELGLWYYGVKCARGCHPDDLGSSYFTSSKRTAALWRYWGPPSYIRIREFKTTESARRCETRALRRIMSRLGWDKTWMNRNINDLRLGAHSEETKRKMSETHRSNAQRRRDLGLELSEAQKAHAVDFGKRWKGVKRGPFSAEHREKLALAKKGRTLSEEHRANISKSHSSERVQTYLNTPVTCPRCGKICRHAAGFARHYGKKTCIPLTEL